MFASNSAELVEKNVAVCFVHKAAGGGIVLPSFFASDELYPFNILVRDFKFLSALPCKSGGITREEYTK